MFTTHSKELCIIRRGVRLGLVALTANWQKLSLRRENASLNSSILRKRVSISIRKLVLSHLLCALSAVLDVFRKMTQIPDSSVLVVQIGGDNNS